MTTSKIATMMQSVSQGSNVKGNAKSDKASGFDSIINMSINNKAGTVQSSTSSSCTDDTKEQSDSANTVNSSSDGNTSATDTKKADSSNATENNSNVSKTSKTKEKSDVSDKDLKDSISEVENLIRDKVKDILGITDEELDAMLSSVGLAVIQLLNPDNIKVFAVEINGEKDLSSILTNEDVLNTFETLNQAISEIPVEDITGMTSEQLGRLADDTMNYLSHMQSVIMLDENVMPSNNEIALSEEKDVPMDDDTQVINSDEKVIDIKITSQSDKEADVSDNNTSFTNNERSNTSHSQDTRSATQNYNVFMENLNNAVTFHSISDDFAGAAVQVKQMQKIVNQIVEQIKVNVAPDNTSMELMLNPENLGKVNFTVTAKNGSMTAQFIVETQTAKQAIEGQIQVLRDNLESQGVKVDAVEVTVSNMSEFTRDESSNSGNTSKQSNQRKTRQINLNTMDDDFIAKEDKVVAQMMRLNGSSVDFTA